MKRAFLAAVAVVFSSLLADAQATGTPTALRIRYAPGGGSVLTFIAKDKGFFKQEGIDADLVPFNSSADGLNALLAGKIDIGVSFGTGGPLTFIAKGQISSSSAAISPADTPSLQSQKMPLGSRASPTSGARPWPPQDSIPPTSSGVAH